MYTNCLEVGWNIFVNLEGWQENVQDPQQNEEYATSNLRDLLSPELAWSEDSQVASEKNEDDTSYGATGVDNYAKSQSTRLNLERLTLQTEKGI